MNLLHTSCKKATYLVSKKEEGKLTWLESIRLRSHLSICSLCRKFEEQSAFIGKMAKDAAQQLTLSADAKNRIRKSLEEDRGS